ncbi:MAG: YraN family protein [bacterium]|nr:YraN family protein [bacterium]
MTTKELGDLGEKLACEYLVKKGYSIVCKNYRIDFGEVDVIAKKSLKWFSKADKTIHFVEVKALLVKQSFHPELAEGSAKGFYPEQHVDYKKQQKLRRMAEIWLQKNNYPQDFPYQIDVIGISINETTRNAKLHYFPNAV